MCALLATTPSTAHLRRDLAISPVIAAQLAHIGLQNPDF
jgi:hypothetical protein